MVFSIELRDFGNYRPTVVRCWLFGLWGDFSIILSIDLTDNAISNII